MDNSGVVRQLDNLGRIVIPAEFRREVGMQIGDPIEIYCRDDVVYLRKYDQIDTFRTHLTNFRDTVEKENRLSREQSQELRKILHDLLDLI